MALCDVNNIEVSKTDLVHYSHWVETDYIGLKNGILDQPANVLSENDYLLSMDCKTGEYSLIEKSAEMPEFEVVVVYSGVTKALMGTDYNNRVDECRVAGWIIQDLVNEEVSALEDIQLRDISVENYHKYRDQVPGRFRRRLDHYFSEQECVHKGIEAWQDGDINRFGDLMFESGKSSVYQYESGSPERISIFEILQECSGVYGARFSGAGYRGSCIGLIDPKYKEEIKKQIDRIYPQVHPAYKDVYKVHFCKTDDGARVVHLTGEGRV